VSSPTTPLDDVLVATEHVVLVDALGRPTGTIAKAMAHHAQTPLHLAFSCYLVRADGKVLLTRRADTKRTFPGVWTNACCGHPSLGETLREAIERRTASELGTFPADLTVLLADYAYRATMDDGTAEHELCPVVVGRVDSPPQPDPAEVGATEWVTWRDLVERAQNEPQTLSPWCAHQVGLLAGHALEIDAATAVERTSPVLDRPIEITPAPSAPEHPRVALRRQPTLDPLAPVLEPLEQHLGAFLSEKGAELEAIDPELAEVSNELRAVVDAGGKRLRPAFVHWGHEALGPEPDSDVLPAAAAMELLHTFALVHDDVMDRSEMRRGRAATHVAFSDGHRARGDGGDARWFGTSAAILAGDLAHVWADESFERSQRPPETMHRARGIYATLRTEVIAGQHLDLRLAGQAQADEVDATNVALLKSARYTVTRPLLLGAALAGPADRSTETTESALTAYGDAVGVAFQMRDDVLGLFGDDDATGKGSIEDLREGKRTVLVLRALRLASAAGRAELLDALGDPDLDAWQAERCREIVADSGALASVERMIASSHEQALGHLNHLPPAPRSALTTLAERAITRDR